MDLADFRPTAKWEMLRRRAEVLKRLRAFFDRRGFLEVEIPILSADTVIDRHLDPFTTILAGDPRRPEQGRTLYLQTSPEFGMKRLLAASDKLVEENPPAIYTVAKVFRNGESGPRHNPEFTLVEWYRAGDDLAAGMQLLSDLAAELLGRGDAELLSYGEAFRRHVGLCPHSSSTAELIHAAGSRGVVAPESAEKTPAAQAEEQRDLWLELLLGECIEKHLGAERPTILYDYPASQAALAQLRQEPGYQVAERFELYVDGVELANGYHELLDPEVLAERNRVNNAQRHSDGKPRLPEVSRLLAAMQHGLPACAGVALGFDRLVMLATGAKTIDEVIAFPIDRA